MNYVYVVTVTYYSEGYDGECYDGECNKSTSVVTAFNAAKTYCAERNKRSGGSNYDYEAVELK